MSAEELYEAGAELMAARIALAAAKDKAIRAAKDAKANGMPETRIANILRVDRARTLRPWLSKP